MQTHDEETRKFFKHSSVHCVLCPRSASSKLSILKRQVYTLFLFLGVRRGEHIWQMNSNLIFEKVVHLQQATSFTIFKHNPRDPLIKG